MSCLIIEPCVTTTSTGLLLVTNTHRNTEIFPHRVQDLDGTELNALCFHINQPRTKNCQQVRQLTVCSSDTQWPVQGSTDTQTQLTHMPTLWAEWPVTQKIRRSCGRSKRRKTFTETNTGGVSANKKHIKNTEASTEERKPTYLTNVRGVSLSNTNKSKLQSFTCTSTEERNHSTVTSKQQLQSSHRTVCYPLCVTVPDPDLRHNSNISVTQQFAKLVREVAKNESCILGLNTNLVNQKWCRISSSECLPLKTTVLVIVGVQIIKVWSVCFSFLVLLVKLRKKQVEWTF